MSAAYWEPDKSLAWFDQVLDLEARGKPTTVAAHMLAVAARARSEGGKQVKRQERDAGQDWEDE